MTENSNIILVTDNNSIVKNLINNKILLRKCDNIISISYNNFKKCYKTFFNKLILLDINADNNVFKQIKQVTALKNNNILVIPILQDYENELVLKCLDCNVYDCIFLNSNSFDISMKMINAIKTLSIATLYNRTNTFLTNIGVYDYKMEMYNFKYFEDLYNVLSSYNGFLVNITLKDAVKTKVSINRLGIILSTFKRSTDIILKSKNGHYYIIYQNIEYDKLQELLNDLQEKFGSEYPLRIGVSLLKNNLCQQVLGYSEDSLALAIKNNSFIECIEMSQKVCLNVAEDKNYKFLKNLFYKKLDKLLKPTFNRYSNLFKNKLKKVEITHYVNDIEILFNIKSTTNCSELNIKPVGYSKFEIQIIHEGLFTEENSYEEISISKFNENYLIKLLNKLYEEYIKSMKGVINGKK